MINHTPYSLEVAFEDEELSALALDIHLNFSRVWALNDGAHRWEHFYDVYKAGVHIRDTLGLPYGDRLILLAAMFHDLFAWRRANHHEMSYWFVKTTDYAPIVALSDEDRELLAMACREHRASFTGEFHSDFSELINAADLGMPNTETWLTRSIRCQLKDGTEGEFQRAYGAARDHLYEKFGPDGYVRVPEMHRKCFPTFREDMLAYVEALTQDSGLGQLHVLHPNLFRPDGTIDMYEVMLMTKRNVVI